MLEKIKLALRISTDAFDSELNSLKAAALADMELVGIMTDEADPLIERAVITYCRLHFGSPPDFDKLEKAYYWQKAQLKTSSQYAVPPEVDDGTLRCN